ncbi:MAG: prolipoprotein diacylglyceryl transferase [Bacteroidales bacterium]|nr:prolipoprotein diacylglyceryl transferase [Bacteroidales bacterium]
MELLTFTWYADPEIFSIAGRGIRWYGLLLAIGFLLGYIILSRVMKKENYDEKLTDKLAICIIVGCVIGLRLGHCLFYDPGYYLTHPLDILKIWEGGLASHGGAIGIIVAILIFCKKHKMQFLEAIDKAALVSSLAGAFVRVGNFMNSEILGLPTDLPWGVKFLRNSEDYYNALAASNGSCGELDFECLSNFCIARHPTQLYEAIFYLAMFFGFFFIYKKFTPTWKKGTFLGWFLTTLFGFRFIIEYTKTEQAEFIWNSPITMGQLLSIPFIIFGIVLIIRQYKGKKKEA